MTGLFSIFAQICVLLLTAVATGAQAQQAPAEAPPSPQHYGQAGESFMMPERVQMMPAAAARFGDGHRHRQGMMVAHGAMMQIMFAAVDADGNGSLSLEEIQSVHKRVFRHTDANEDGELAGGNPDLLSRQGQPERFRHRAIIATPGIGPQRLGAVEPLSWLSRSTNSLAAEENVSGRAWRSLAPVLCRQTHRRFDRMHIRTRAWRWALAESIAVT